MNRRQFIGLTSSALTANYISRADTGAFDDNLAVFISDPHVNADPTISRYMYPREWLVKTVSEILALRPRPRHVFCFGDLVFDHGMEGDYQEARKILTPLTDAGIKMVHAMGNHDRRLNFAKHFPEAAAQTVVPGRFVTVTHLPHCDFIMLDSLKGDNDGKVRGPVEGELNQAEANWLKANLPTWKRPVFLGAHHSIRELHVGKTSLIEFLGACPNFAGWIHGHDHRWLPNWTTAWNTKRRTLRLLTLPSNGLWGDIGYVLFKMDAKSAVATLVPKDFWNPVPGRPSAAVCNSMLSSRANQSCVFAFENVNA